MTDRECKLVIGALLHDIGKVIYRPDTDKRGHSQSGYDFLKEEAGVKDGEVLDCVRCHHVDARWEAGQEDDSLSYVVSIANRIASMDRRHADPGDTAFAVSMPLRSVFNRLNRNQQEFYYEPGTLDPEGDIRYPVAEKKAFDKDFYDRMRLSLLDGLRGMEWTREYVNALLEVLEAELSFVPSIAAEDEMADISLFDHLKLTAAIASCVMQHMEESGYNFVISDLEMFRLYSVDLSGIQDFIYTITDKNALKTLRARSFYLEIMMEHIIDCLLEELHLSRANVIYAGGGHCYILTPNTKRTNDAVEAYMGRLNQWLLEQFQISLYAAWGYAACSADSLKNVPEGSYAEIFKGISDMIAAKKSHRYFPSDLLTLNQKRQRDYTRECKVCRRIARVSEEGICPTCLAIQRFSGNVLYRGFYTVTEHPDVKEDALPLPGGYYLTAEDEASFRKGTQEDGFIRAYSKNRMGAGKYGATKLWVGDYTTGKIFDEFAEEAEGVSRIGVLRADVDNLGQAFVSGFDNPANGNRYVTLSRTATLSRHLSLFFKLHINQILRESSFSINGKEAHSRNAAICYSGGDDLFLVGAWNEILELAVDIREKFKRYTQGTLTISAGIGMYEASYPISVIADEVAKLEEKAKELPGKDAVTVFGTGESTWHWEDFTQRVIQEKYKVIYDFFTVSEERGMNFLYQILDLIRNRTEKIHFARYVYLLSRMEPDRDAGREQREAYRVFSEKMYQWIRDDEDRRQLITAIYLYTYLTREKEETGHEGE